MLVVLIAMGVAWADSVVLTMSQSSGSFSLAVNDSVTVTLTNATTGGSSSFESTCTPVTVNYTGSSVTIATSGSGDLTILYAPDAGISGIDLSGATGLVKLILPGNSLSGAIDLSALEALEEVDLSYNSITSLTLPGAEDSAQSTSWDGDLVVTAPGDDSSGGGTDNNDNSSSGPGGNTNGDSNGPGGDTNGDSGDGDDSGDSGTTSYPYIVTTIDSIDDYGLYVLYTNGRGVLGYGITDGYSFAGNTSDAATDVADNEAYQFRIYYTDGAYYLYNVEADAYVVAANATTTSQSSATAFTNFTDVYGVTSVADEEYRWYINDGSSLYVNMNSVPVLTIDWWSTYDAGNVWAILKVGTVTESVAEGIRVLNVAGNTGLTELDIDELEALEELNIAGTGISTAPTLSSSARVEVYISSGQSLSELPTDMSTKKLQTLWINGSTLEELDVSRTSDLRSLYAPACGISTLTLGTQPALEDLWVEDNSLSGELDLSDSESLKAVCIDGNSTSLTDLSWNTSAQSTLEYFYGDDNGLFYNSLPTVANLVDYSIGKQESYTIVESVAANARLNWKTYLGTDGFGNSYARTYTVTGTNETELSSTDDYTRDGYVWRFLTEQSEVNIDVTSSDYGSITLSIATFEVTSSSSSTSYTTVTDIDDIYNGGVYVMYTARGLNYYDESDINTDGSISDISSYADQENYQFLLIQYNGYYYIYSVGAEQWLTGDGSGGHSLTSDIDDAIGWSITDLYGSSSSEYVTEVYRWYFTASTLGSYFLGNNNTGTLNIDNWSTVDQGDSWALVYVDETDVTELLESFGIEIEEEALEDAEELLGLEEYVGGYSTETLADLKTAYAAYVADPSDTNLAALEAAVEEVQNSERLALEIGTYYNITSASSRNTGWYIYHEPTVYTEGTESNELGLSTKADSLQILYGDSTVSNYMAKLWRATGTSANSFQLTNANSGLSLGNDNTGYGTVGYATALTSDGGANFKLKSAADKGTCWYSFYCNDYKNYPYLSAGKSGQGTTDSKTYASIYGAESDENTSCFLIKRVRTIPVTISSKAEWSSIYLGVDVEVGEGLTAYVGQKSGSKIATIEITDGIIPAGTPALLYAEGGGTFELNILTTEPTDPAAESLTNDLSGVTLRDSTMTQNEYYGLSYFSSTGVGFYISTLGVISANKAYLVKSGSSESSYFLLEEGLVEGIGSLIEEADGETIYYDLQGRRVLKPQAGNIYITSEGEKIMRSR